ncbi:Invasion associated locus B (IalB) protein [Rhodobacteraceae bacterium THAF1]|uniref:invasion associated locus B family protein n=1 Tax=Palleronia sp. THAF1 TaxID=2587842 RepID=UPI000F3BFD95|nr:invasion associated locus B family protein [Palleronia sp. THAF1]QFU08557.1 Invasion associated locus B (IalB) protein [Palleronia sp. THAF1]VDC30609.1 Invasion associated locus B (IalB) protein [Rhodobacteraceae bacterium THAF1]
MSDLLKSLCLAGLLVGFAPAAIAQDATDDTATEAPATEPAQDVVTPTDPNALNMGEPAAEEADASDAAGTNYIAETFGDWEQRCVRRPEGADPCQIYQLLRDADGNAVAEMSVFPLPAGQPAVAGSTIITPLETLLTKNITISVDGSQARRYPFEFCAAQGCLSRIGFSQGEIDQFKRGAAGRLTIFPAAAPETPINLTISLSGFTAAFESVTEANTAQ